MRGKAFCIDLTMLVVWITPACAGKRPILVRAQPDDWDHPRMCGEKLPIWQLVEDMQGSPPHVRGKAGTKLFTSCFFRITPACAGKRTGVNGASLGSQDHPRMCGEKWNEGQTVYERSGSPPHVRGKGCQAVRCHVEVRITPACAGKSA